MKALGIGIAYSVSQLDFSLPPSITATGVSVPITLSIDGIPQHGWDFSEFTIDDSHVGAIACQVGLSMVQPRINSPVPLIDITAVIRGLEPLNELDANLGRQFAAKLEKLS